MIAFLVMISFVVVYFMGRMVGRFEGVRAYERTLTHLRSELSMEDKLLFDQWFAEYKAKYTAKERAKV